MLHTPAILRAWIIVINILFDSIFLKKSIVDKKSRGNESFVIFSASSFSLHFPVHLQHLCSSQKQTTFSVSRIPWSYQAQEARVRAIQATSALPRTKIVLPQCNPTMLYAYVRQHKHFFFWNFCVPSLRIT